MSIKNPQSAGLITDKDLYTIKEFKRRLGLSTLAILLARINGLPVHKINGKKFILGKDFIAYLESRKYPMGRQTAGSIPKCPHCHGLASPQRS